VRTKSLGVRRSEKLSGREKPLAGLRSQNVFLSARSLSLASLVLITAGMTQAATVLSGGSLIYMLDDAYIHLAIAKNLIEHGTYGIEPGVFSSASSSPGWTVLLAAIGWIAPSALHLAPFALNLASAIFAVTLLSRSAHARVFQQGGTVAHVFWLFLPVVLFLPSLILIGMEHMLHAALALLIVDLWLTVIAALMSDTRPSGRTLLGMGLLVAAATTIRYESMFLVAGLVLGLIVISWTTWSECHVVARKIAVPAATLILPSVAMIALIGVVQRLFGHHFLPNPLLVKTALGGETGLRALIPNLYSASWNFRHEELATGLLAAFTWILVWGHSRRFRLAMAVAAAWILVAVLHGTYASFMGFWRYQTYLILAGTFLLLQLVSREEIRWSPLKTLAVLLAGGVLFAVSPRAQTTLYTPLASNNIYEQQGQMARFMRAEYPNMPVAVNDLGLMAFRHNGPVLDLIGLGNDEVLRARREGRFTESFIEDITARRRVEIAIIYDQWVRAPSTWIKVAEWQSSRRQISPAFSTVSFYATSFPAAARLADRMSIFQRTLPSTVEVRILHAAGNSNPTTHGR
jgi:hypothetical protein